MNVNKYAKLRKLSRVDNEPVDATKTRVDSIEVSEVLRLSRLKGGLDTLGQKTAIGLNSKECTINNV